MNFLSKLGKKAVEVFDSGLNEVEYRAKQLDQARHNAFGTYGKDSWEQKAVDAIDTATANSIVGVADSGATVAGDLVGKATKNPSLGAAAGLLIGAVLPGPDGKSKPPKKKFTFAQRDAAVMSNTPPKRTDLSNPADFRAITGDVQAGNTGLSMRMENRPEYKSLTTSTGQTGKGAPLQTSTTHHRMGIQDQQAFVAGKTPKEMQTLRETLGVGGLFMGNQRNNYEALYDGVFTKAGRKAGMFSTDHGDVHKLASDLRTRMGIGVNKKDRALDTFLGRPIKDLPNDVKQGLQIRLALEDEMIINKVQAARYKTLREAFPNLTYEQRRQMILEQPDKFANLSTNVLND